MPSFCVVSNCELKYSHSDNVSFHKFPLRNPTILQEWIKFTDRGPNWKPSRWSSICSRHFHNTDFRDYVSRKCLKKSAVPSIVTRNNNISYETYRICNTTASSSENTRTQQSDQDDDSTTLVVSETDYNGRVSMNKMSNDLNQSIDQQSENINYKPVTESVENCRLCGDRIDHLTCGALGSLDDQEIDTMFRKCLPTVNIRQDADHSRIVCIECASQLRQYSDFIDRVLLYQRDLDINISYDNNLASSENLFHSNCALFFEPNAQITNTSGATMFIKQEPINVKQEILDISNKKPPEMHSSSIQVAAPKIGPTFTTQILSAAPIVNLPSTDTMKQINVVEQQIRWPQSECNTSTYCRHCDRIFVSNFELKTHTCTIQAPLVDRETINCNTNNNCEIMEIITLNNPISFIDLAEDECGGVEQNKFKMENIADLDRRERVELEHAYAKRVTPTACHLKQEIELNYESEVIQNSNGDASVTDLNEIVDNTLAVLKTNGETAENIYICPKCDQSFASIHLLNEHLAKLHTLKNKICPICSAEFKSIYEYLLHKSKVHLLGYQCKQCKRKFTTRFSLKNHERSSCTIESMDFYYSCRHCGKCMRNLIKMKEHLRNRSSNKCRLNFVTSKQANNPLNALLSDEILECNKISNISRKKYTCDVCTQSFSRQKYFHLHKEMHLKMQQKRAEKLKNETSLDNGNMFLPQAKEKGANEPAIDLMGIKLVADNSKFIFVNENGGDSMQRITTAATPSMKIPINGKFVCETCGKPFSTFANLRQHKSTHDTERKFNCSLCPKTFKGVSGLKQHVSGFHYKIKPFSCPVCNYSYALKGDMQRCRHSKLKNLC